MHRSMSTEAARLRSPLAALSDSVSWRAAGAAAGGVVDPGGLTGGEGEAAAGNGEEDGGGDEEANRSSIHARPKSATGSPGDWSWPGRPEMRPGAYLIIVLSSILLSRWMWITLFGS